METLRGKMPIVLITNGHTRIQRAKIESCGIGDYVDAIFIAQEVGYSKPLPEIFSLALEHVGLPAPSVLMVGDHPEKDILGGHNSGLQTAWMQRKPPTKKQHIQPDYTVYSMKEVLNLIERSNQ